MRYNHGLRMWVLAGAEGTRRMWAIGSGGLYFFERGFRVVLSKNERSIRLHRPDRLLPMFIRRAMCARKGHPITEWVVNYDAFKCRCGEMRATGFTLARR